MTSLYGQIVSGEQVENAALATVKLWWPAYAAEIGRQSDLDDPLLNFRSYNPAFGVGSAVTDQLPACLVVCPRLSGTPEKLGRRYTAIWTLAVGAVVASTSFETANRLTQRYAAGLRALILQHASLGGFAQSAVWVGETYDELTAEDDTTVLGCLVTFDLVVADVLDVGMGPATPPADPGVPAEWPTVEEVVVDVELREGP